MGQLRFHITYFLTMAIYRLVYTVLCRTWCRQDQNNVVGIKRDSPVCQMLLVVAERRLVMFWCNVLRPEHNHTNILQKFSTHWGRDIMAAVSQTTFSKTFSWMKMSVFRLKSHWSLFMRFQLTNIPALVQIMALRRPGDDTLFEPMMVRLPTHIRVTRPQWVKWIKWPKFCRRGFLKMYITIYLTLIHTSQTITICSGRGFSTKQEISSDTVVIHLCVAYLRRQALVAE